MVRSPGTGDRKPLKGRILFVDFCAPVPHSFELSALEKSSEVRVVPEHLAGLGNERETGREIDFIQGFWFLVKNKKTAQCRAGMCSQLCRWL